MSAVPLEQLLFDLEGMQKRERLLKTDLIESFIKIVKPRDDQFTEDALACEKSLETFTRGAWHVVEPSNPYVPGWHLTCISEHLQAMDRLELRNLVINMPPRHCKSLKVCVFWFCHNWTQTPESRWLFSSYSDALSVRDSRKCQDIITSPWYQARWGHLFRLRTGERAMGKFTNTRQGYRIATSVGGRGLGEGGDYLIADDPHKAADIYSPAIRNRVLRWWSESMSTRGNDPRTVRKVIVMQRLHEMDLSGYILASELGYEHLCLPAEFEPKRIVYFLPEGSKKPKDAIVLTKLQRERPDLQDPRKEEGELLWPQRFGPAEIKAIKAELRTVGSAGQLGQRPAPPEGDIFKRDDFRYFTEEKDAEGNLWFVIEPLETGGDPVRVPEKVCRWYQTTDTAIETNATSKYTACITFVSAPVKMQDKTVRRFLLVYDAWRDRIEVKAQYDSLIKIRKRYPRLVFQAIEKRATGNGIIQEGAASGYPFYPLNPHTDNKVVRAAAVSQLYHARVVCHRRGMPELTDYEDELLSFPTAQYDDWVDCTAYGGILFNDERILTSGLEFHTYPTAEEVAKAAPGGEIIKVGEVEVYFPDGDTDSFLRGF